MVTEDGFGKRVPIKAFPKGVAGRVGVIGCKVSIILRREFALAFFLFPGASYYYLIFE